jgi:hypothetical protein
MQLEQVQMDFVWARYRVFFIFPNMQIFADCTVCTVLTWQLTIQFIRPYNDDMVGYGPTRGRWHGRVLSWHGLTWQGRTCSVVDKWTNPVVTNVILLGQCYGATWPSRGVQHGTPPIWLEFGKIIWLQRSQICDLRAGGSDLAGPWLPARPWMRLNHMMYLNLFEFTLWFGWHWKGMGLSPNP